MCYAAQLEHEFKQIARHVKAETDYASFEKLFDRRLTEPKLKIPKAMEANFYSPTTPAEKRIAKLIEEFHGRRTKELEAELFKLKKRLADATRKLEQKETKKAIEDQRIATDKIKQRTRWLTDVSRTKLKESDSKIFSMHYAPMVIMEDGHRLIRPMRYNCRPHGMPESIDTELGTLYNARRDNLEKFWKRLFGHTHGVVVMSSFYEHVALHDYEHREKREGEKSSDLVLHFNPTPKMSMLVACLWSHWEAKGKPDLDSFAAITDEPPPEIAATGHERCIIPLKLTNLEIWLQPEKTDLKKLYSVMDDRVRPQYEHQLAA